MSWSAPVRHLVLDLDETVIQREQEFGMVNGKLSPLLEPIFITARYPDGSVQNRKYYLRPGIRDFLTDVIRRKERGELEVGFLSFSHQDRLNAVLREIKINGTSLIDRVGFAFGQEAVDEFHRKMHPGILGAKKDLRLTIHPEGLGYWNRLKNSDLTVLSDIKPHLAALPSRIALIDDRVDVTLPEQRNRVIQVNYRKKDEGYWREFQKAVVDTAPKLEDVEAREKFLATHTTELEQYKSLSRLLDIGKDTDLPNDYTEWTKLLRASEVVVTEKIHFKYLIPDLLKLDSSNSDILVLGRDGDLLYDSLQATKDNGKVKSSLYYLEISRPIAANSSREEILKILSASGIDVDQIRSGKRKLRVVDTGYEGSVPRQIIRALFEGDSAWKTKAKNVSAFLISTFTAGGASPEDFTTFDHYLKSGGFIEYNPHLFRFGPERIREMIYYWEHNRPREHTRPYKADSTGKILAESSHPTAIRFNQMLHAEVTRYFSTPEVQKEIASRLDFVAGRSGSFPDHWQKEESLASTREVRPRFPEGATLEQTRRIILEAEVGQSQAAKLLAEHHDGNKAWIANQHRIRDQGFKRYVNPDVEPPIVKHLQDNRTPQDGNFAYDPGYLEERQVEETKPERPLDFDEVEARALRERSLLHLSRSASPEMALNNSKSLSVQKEALPDHTIRSNRASTDLLLANRNTEFKSATEVERFLLSIARAYLDPIRPSSEPFFRDWDYVHPSSMGLSTEHPEKLEKDWKWFCEWLHGEMKRDYAPEKLGAEVHYLLATKIHPFYDGVGKTTRDIVDFLFIRKGRLPPDWTKLKFQEYMKNTTTLHSTSALIEKASSRISPHVRTLSTDRACRESFGALLPVHMLMR